LLTFFVGGLVCMLTLVGTATIVQAAPFTYSIEVSGDGVTGSGSITLPGDVPPPGFDPANPTGVQLSLTATIFGNLNVLFTEANVDLFLVDWVGADPGTPPDLTFTFLDLSRDVTVGGSSVTLMLSDDGGGAGGAVCSGGPSCVVVGNATANAADIQWRYTPQAVPEPTTLLLLLSGFGIVRVVGGRHSSRS
jgi:hypothetical protein